MNGHSLQAKASVYQLIEEFELGVLRKDSFLSKKADILSLLRKSDLQTQSLVATKLLFLHSRMRIPIDQTLFTHSVNVLENLLSIGKQNERKFCEIVMMEKVDETFLLFSKSFPHCDSLTRHKVETLFLRMNALRHMMSRMMPKKDF